MATASWTSCEGMLRVLCSSAATELHGSSCWSSCSIPSQLLQLAVATALLCYVRPMGRLSSQLKATGCEFVGKKFYAIKSQFLLWWAQCLVYEYKILIMLDHFNHSSRTRNIFAKAVPINSFDYLRPVSLIESQLPTRWLYQVTGCWNPCECKHLVWYINDGLLSVEKLYFYM